MIFSARRSEIPDTRDLGNTNVVNKLGTLDDRGVRPSDHNPVITDFDVVPLSAPTPTPVPAPVLLTQGSTDRAIAMHSTFFTDEPFYVRTSPNLSSDSRTRIMLFAKNLDLLAGETASSVSVHARDSRGITFELAVEQVLKVPNFSWLSTVIVRLPDDRTINGDLFVTVGIRGGSSNTAKVGIRAP